jgi:hypothetical protein
MMDRTEQDRADLMLASGLAQLNEGLWQFRATVGTTAIEAELDALQATLAELSARCSLAVAGRHHEAVAQEMSAAPEGEQTSE